MVVTKTNFQPKIEFRDPKSLTPYQNNNRSHPTEQIDKLAGAIAEFDFDQPIVVDAKGIVIKGHGRRLAAIRLGLKQVPVIVRSDLSPAQIKATRLADNRVAESGKADYQAIALEIEALAELDFDLSLTGFDEAEIDKFLSDSQTDLELGEPGEGGGSEPDDDSEKDSNSTAQSPAEKYPLAIVLTAGQKQRWDDVKDRVKLKSDTAAFLKLLEEM